MKTIKMNHRIYLLTFALVFFLPALAEGPVHKDGTTLKEAYKDKFLIGTALNRWIISGRDSASLDLVKKQFNAISPGNDMKWERIHPRPGEYNFGPADRYVEFGEENGMNILCHVLIWHSQTPPWVFQDGSGEPAGRDTLLRRMKDHISTIMGRYRDRIDCWDVVNEALNDDGTIRDNNWSGIIGKNYVEKAFTFAREAAPDAYLIYNDYSLANPKKRDGAVRLIRDLQSKGIRVDAIGMQGHYSLDNPTIENLEASIEAFAALGVDVLITELDISVLPSPWGYSGADIRQNFELRKKLNPYPDSLPDSMQVRLADRYADLFRVFVNHSDQVARVTFWGVTDRGSWKNNFPVRGRTDYPLLFDRDHKPKPAFDAVIRVAGGME